MNMFDKLRKKRDLKEAYIHVFTTEEGQKVLQHICKEAFVFSTTFVRGDPQETMLREGQRRLALSIIKFIHREDQQLYDILKKEHENATED